MVWVIVFHVFTSMPTTLSTLDSDDHVRFQEMQNTYLMRPVLNGTMGVDVFFVLSGFLIMAILSREIVPPKPRRASPDESTSLINNTETASDSPPIWPALAKFFARRYLRIAPAYLLVLVVAVVSDVLGTPLGSDEGDCTQYFWRNILFVQNFFPEVCMPWTWSVAVEWQMYLMSPFIVLATLRWPRWAKAQLALLACFSLGCYMGPTPSLVGTEEYHQVVYRNPLARMSSYVFGMALAVVIREQHDHFQKLDETTATERSRLTWGWIVYRVASVLLTLVTIWSSYWYPSHASWWNTTLMVVLSNKTNNARKIFFTHT